MMWLPALALALIAQRFAPAQAPLSSTPRSTRVSVVQPSEVTKDSPSFWEITTQDPDTTFNAILVLFTGVLALVAGWQLWFIHKAQETGKISADAARDAANAAKLTVETMKLTAQHELRAYVHIERATAAQVIYGVPVEAE